MSTLLAGTDAPETSERLCDYLETRLSSGDDVHVLNSLPGGNDEELVEDGREALAVFEDRLGDRVTVETYQNTSESDPAHDLLTRGDEHGVDEIVIGLSQKRSPAQKVVFGSITQSVLMQTNRPVVGVPLPD
jgi:nucleotide-binding universal stress UspA family protein